MTYSDRETGALGSPLEVFLFQRRGYRWPYTSADRSVSFQGITFQPVTISRGAFDRKDDSGSNQVEVRLDRTLKVCSQFLEGSTPTPVSLTIYRMHRSDPEHIVMFKGAVANARLEGEEVSLTCVSALSAQEKSVPRQLIMRTCPHVLYGPMCRLNSAAYGYEGTLTEISGSVYLVESMTSAPYTTDIFTAGVLFKPSTGQRAFIQDHFLHYTQYSHKFRLLQPVPGWGASDTLIAYMGCDRKHSTCRDKFDNIPNFGGFPLHPERNPIYDLMADEQEE